MSTLADRIKELVDEWNGFTPEQQRDLYYGNCCDYSRDLLSLVTSNASAILAALTAAADVERMRAIVSAKLGADGAMIISGDEANEIRDILNIER